MSNYRITSIPLLDGLTKTVNANKCKYMVISKLRSRATPSQQMLFSQPMNRVTSYKYLGVILSDDLSWSPEIEMITSKARRMVGML